METTNELTRSILESAFKVHSAIGPGLLESTYEECLYYELKKKGLRVEKQKSLPLIYEEVKLEVGYRIDLYVEQLVVVEIKATDTLNPVFVAQLLTYMKLSGTKVGLLLNFNVRSLKEGIKRLIL